jgi:hypothetical protein
VVFLLVVVPLYGGILGGTKNTVRICEEMRGCYNFTRMTFHDSSHDANKFFGDSRGQFN